MLDSFIPGGAILVCGPPASGKTTYVEKCRDTGDLVYDFDTLACAIYCKRAALTGSHSFPGGQKEYDEISQIITPMREAMITVWKGLRPRPRLWLIMSGASREHREYMAQRLFNANVIVLQTSQEECLKRCASDPIRRQHYGFWDGAILNWFLAYERDSAI